MAGLYGRFELKDLPSGTWLTFYLHEEAWTFAWRKYSAIIAISTGGYSNGTILDVIPVDAELWSEEVFLPAVEAWYDAKANGFRKSLNGEQA